LDVPGGGEDAGVGHQGEAEGLGRLIVVVVVADVAGVGESEEAA
jgi:hypothetical protein